MERRLVVINNKNYDFSPLKKLYDEVIYRDEPTIDEIGYWDEPDDILYIDPDPVILAYLSSHITWYAEMIKDNARMWCKTEEEEIRYACERTPSLGLVVDGKLHDLSLGVYSNFPMRGHYETSNLIREIIGDNRRWVKKGIFIDLVEIGK